MRTPRLGELRRQPPCVRGGGLTCAVLRGPLPRPTPLRGLAACAARPRPGASEPPRGWETLSCRGRCRV